MPDIQDCQIDDTLLAIADGIEEELPQRFDGCWNRLNNHDTLARSGPAPAFCPEFSLAKGNQWICLHVGREGLSLWNQDNFHNEGTIDHPNHKIIPTININYSDPHMMQHLFEAIEQFFKGDINGLVGNR